LGEGLSLKIKHAALASAALFVASATWADASKEVQYGPVPSWVAPAPINTVVQLPSDAMLRFVYQDTQQRVGSGTEESYTAYRVKLLKPEALALGNIRLTWSPSAGSATVHFVRIIRDRATIDVLKDTKLKVIQRETGLEQSMLDGNLTATLQVPDLRVGDDLEVAATISSTEAAFGNHNAGIATLPGGIPGSFRYRLLWPAASTIKTRQSRDLPLVKPTTQNEFKTLNIELHDPPTIPDVEGAPTRYNVHRVVEYSDYKGWAALSKQMFPLFDKASQLEPNSPLRAEAAKIAAASSDPAARAEAALRLVQDQVRYVFVGLDGGNYMPVSVDETWKRRFGDCKAKTVLLLALLRELGIAAEPMLVNSNGGDGTDEHLPDPKLFDHVLVRATVTGKDVWLDGTRLGDRHLDMIPATDFEWALPLSARGSDLVNVPTTPTAYPQLIEVVDIDATGGFDKDAIWKVTQVIHGDQGFAIDTSLASASAADADRAVKAYFREQLKDVDPDQVGWRYDERHGTVVLTMKGKGKLDWDGDSSEGHNLTLIGGGFYPPSKMERPKDQDQNAAWSVNYPKFRCDVTTVHLPVPTKAFHWTYSSKPMDRQIRGVAYFRLAGLQNNVVRTVRSSRSLVREIPASEAAQINAEIPSFDNHMSTVEESALGAVTNVALPFTQEPDWAVDPSLCSPPAK
jgi:hypothetical protein